MGQYRWPGRPSQCRVDADVKALNHRVNRLDARFEAIEDAGFALPAMGDEGADMALRLGDRWAMGRPVDLVAAREELVERGHIGGHVAIVRPDGAGRPAEHIG